MAERSNAAVLKTVDLRGSGGSNPSLSAPMSHKFFYNKLVRFFLVPLCKREHHVDSHFEKESSSSK